MSYEQSTSILLQEDGVEQSTMMKTPCLRYQGDFISMWFDKANALIIKVPPERVNELISEGKGMEFNFTKKRFKEWVLIPLEHENLYQQLMHEALQYAKLKKR